MSRSFVIRNTVVVLLIAFAACHRVHCGEQLADTASSKR